MLTIQEKSVPHRFPLFQTEFRLFFFGACVYALFSIALWMAAYTFRLEFDSLIIYQSLQNWHAHEMIFGYTMAVIAGFLLTAVKNWTGIQPANSIKLTLLFLLWAMARIAPYLSDSLLIVASLDILFNLALLLNISITLYRARMWPNFSLITTILTLMLGVNLVFYLGLAGVIDNGAHYGISGGITIIIALIFIMSRRLIPFFIEKALGESVKLKNSMAIDIAGLGIFILFAIINTIDPHATISALLAGSLVIIHSIRLLGWTTAGIWKVPLLWVLYSAYLWIIFGFALKAATLVTYIPPALDTHAYAYGGIGLMTIGMMARISLGHSGRSIYDPPKLLPLIFGLMLVGSLVRVVLPLFTQLYYIELIAASQLLWLAAYTLFLAVYLPMFIQARADGQAG